MKLTPEQLRQNAAAMLALADGKPIQFRSFCEGSEWKLYIPEAMIAPTLGTYEYRPKPEPVVRPWSKPEDVPGPVCWIRFRQQSLPIHCAMIVGVIGKGVVTCDEKNGDAVEWKSLSDDYEHSTDRKTWLPCTVTQ